jgi:hypothetical protein
MLDKAIRIEYVGSKGLFLSKETCERYYLTLQRLANGLETDEIFPFDIVYLDEIIDDLEKIIYDVI